MLFTAVAATLLFRLPTEWAALPLLIGASYMTLGQDIQVGPLHFTVIRILVAVGVMRVLSRKEHISGGMKGIDRMMVLWGIVAVISSVFHEEFSSALITRLALVYDTLGLYFLMRIFLRAADPSAMLGVCQIMIIVLIPLALAMIAERVTGQNFFSMFGGVNPISEVRNGAVRAQGPFAHSILAGTVGAVSWPLALFFWKEKRILSIAGLAAAGAIVLCSGSSGPIMTSMFCGIGLFFWRFRNRMKMIRWLAVLGIIGLDMTMQAPVYYILARIDLTGSSTGWHRAALIESSIKHLNEWWLGGTDYTRHWMPTGVPWSPNHTDITNQYIKIGVVGGLPLMLLLVGILVSAFRMVGKTIKLFPDAPREHLFLIWSFGAILFAHAATWMSISYFDQSIVFPFFILAAIGSLPVTRPRVEPVAEMAPA